MPDVFAGRFELIDPIGTGGTGTVWRAWDRRLERYCAAKVLRQRHAGALLRFVREQGRRLDHPHILSPYGWAADDDQALLAMDLVGGGALSSLSADFGPLPERYVAELLRQLLEALAHIHGQGVVHRDVKPANLLLEATGVGVPSLRLTDFGIALALGEPRLTQQGTIVGTPGYLAPEILAGALPSIQQDLYAAGVTALQLLTGQEPAANTPAPNHPNHAPRPPSPRDTPSTLDTPGVPGATSTVLWAVIEALLHPDPDKRVDSAATSLTHLEPALATALQVPAHTPDNELIEVFDHLPPLPTPHRQAAEPSAQPSSAHAPTNQTQASPQGGPSAAAQPAASQTPGDHSTAGQTTAGQQPDRNSTATRAAAAPAVGDQTVGSHAIGSQTVGSQTVDSHAIGGQAVGGQLVGGELDGGERSSGEVGQVPAAGGRRRQRVLLAVGAGLAAAAVATTAILLTQGDPDDNLRPTGGSNSSTISPPATPPPDSTLPPVPTGTPNPIPDPEVTLGGPCGWQEAGTLETAANGIRVECRKQGSTYRWIRAA